MMSYSTHVYPRCCSHYSPDPNKSNNYKPSGSGQFKLYQFFVFCVPIFFTFVLLFVFYLFYLKPRRVNWSSIRMRTTPPPPPPPPPYDDDVDNLEDIVTVELGLKKEHREMLPIIVYNQSFSVRDTQCAVCLGDYQANDRLQQIPACGHTFHIDCIDSWLSMHTTCPLCRLSLLSSHKSQNESPDVPVELSHASSAAANNVLLQTCEAQTTHLSGLGNGETTVVENSFEDDAGGSGSADSTGDLRDARIRDELHEHTGGSSGSFK